MNYGAENSGVMADILAQLEKELMQILSGIILRIKEGIPISLNFLIFDSEAPQLCCDWELHFTQMNEKIYQQMLDLYKEIEEKRVSGLRPCPIEGIIEEEKDGSQRLIKLSSIDKGEREYIEPNAETQQWLDNRPYRLTVPFFTIEAKIMVKGKKTEYQDIRLKFFPGKVLPKEAFDKVANLMYQASTDLESKVQTGRS